MFQLHKLQRIQDTFGGIVTNHRKYAHVAFILKQLHWLPVKYTYMFKTAILVYNFLHSGSPSYFNHSSLSAVVPIVPSVDTQIVNTLLFLLSAH